MNLALETPAVHQMISTPRSRTLLSGVTQSEFYPLLRLLAFLSAQTPLILALSTSLCELKLLKIHFDFRLVFPFFGIPCGLQKCVCISIMVLAFELHL